MHAWSACSIATNDHACILIWDAHTRMGHNIVPYACTGYPRHTRMGQYTHMGQNTGVIPWPSKRQNLLV